jgi:endonuclease YncB( thermonuclease family)
MGNCMNNILSDTGHDDSTKKLKLNYINKQEELNNINISLYNKQEELNNINISLYNKQEELNNINISLYNKQEELNNIKKDDTMVLNNVTHTIKKFTLNGISMWGKVVHIYDGDTVHIVFNINNSFQKFVCRLAHIDTPEMAPKNITDDDEKNKEKEAATKSRNYLFMQLTDQLINDNISKKELISLCDKSKKLIWVKCFEFDKYGRLLVELYSDNITDKSINMDMIEKKYALPYEGKTKETFNADNFS